MRSCAPRTAGTSSALLLHSSVVRTSRSSKACAESAAYSQHARAPTHATPLPRPPMRQGELTAFCIAAKAGHLEVAMALLDRGALIEPRTTRVRAPRAVWCVVCAGKGTQPHSPPGAVRAASLCCRKRQPRDGPRAARVGRGRQCGGHRACVWVQRWWFGCARSEDLTRAPPPRSNPGRP